MIDKLLRGQAAAGEFSEDVDVLAFIEVGRGLFLGLGLEQGLDLHFLRGVRDLAQQRAQDFLRRAGQRQAGDGVWVHRGDIPWFVRCACEEVAIGSGALWELGPAPDMLNTLEYVPAAGIWRCSWLGPASELMQTVGRRVPRTRQTGGVLWPMTANAYLAAKEKARSLLLEEARGRGCDLNALSTLGLDLAAPPPYYRE